MVTVLVESKHVRTQTEIRFIAPTLNNYACSLPPLGSVSWSAFPECFCQPYNFTTGEMVPMKGSKLAMGPDIAPNVSTCQFRSFSGIPVHCGYLWMS